jgi:hypothetical protein
LLVWHLGVKKFASALSTLALDKDPVNEALFSLNRPEFILLLLREVREGNDKGPQKTGSRALARVVRNASIG